MRCRIDHLEKALSDRNERGLHESDKNIVAENSEQIKKATLILKAVNSPVQQRMMELILYFTKNISS